MEEDLRGHGLGSEILQAVHEADPQKRVIVDIEEPDSSVPNNKQRIQRKAFYLRNGYAWVRGLLISPTLLSRLG